jgi:hypothetical protein
MLEKGLHNITLADVKATVRGFNYFFFQKVVTLKCLFFCSNMNVRSKKNTWLSLIPVKNRCGEAFTMSRKHLLNILPCKNGKFASYTYCISVYKQICKSTKQLQVYIEICAIGWVIKQTERGLYLRKSLAFYLMYMFMWQNEKHTLTRKSRTSNSRRGSSNSGGLQQKGGQQ